VPARPIGGRDDRICVAQIGAAHGLKGEVRLFSFTEKPTDVAAYGPLSSEDGSRQFKINSLRSAKDHFVVKFQGVDDRLAAELLRNIKLYVARARLPDPEDDETYYHVDLIGLSAVGRDGARIGSVAGLYNFGAGELIEIKLLSGRAVLLPFSEAVVPEIDLKSGRIIVDPPAGALEETAPPNPED
jgi:16S rRNA processing protein RimM